MKVPKSLIQAIAVAVTVAVTASACTKEVTPDPEGTEVKKKDGDSDCAEMAVGFSLKIVPPQYIGKI